MYPNLLELLNIIFLKIKHEYSYDFDDFEKAIFSFIQPTKYNDNRKFNYNLNNSIVFFLFKKHHKLIYSQYFQNYQYNFQLNFLMFSDQ